MRKIFALVLALTLLAVPLYAAIATGVDLSGMTNEELTLLKRQLDAEMLDRGMVKSAVLPIGTYVVGKDIPQGEYEFSKANNDDFGSTYELYANEADYKNNTRIDEFGFMDNSVKKVTLDIGQILDIQCGAAKVITFSIQWQ